MWQFCFLTHHFPGVVFFIKDSNSSSRFCIEISGSLLVLLAELPRQSMSRSVIMAASIRVCGAPGARPEATSTHLQLRGSNTVSLLATAAWVAWVDDLLPVLAEWGRETLREYRSECGSARGSP